LRSWNYYLTYCEAGFSSQTLGLNVITFARPNTRTFIHAVPSGRLADPIGPFVNANGAPIFIPAGAL
jgi:hypothetical protein